MAAFDMFTDFVAELKRSDIPVSVVEEIELAKALEMIDLSSLLELKYAMMATLIKSSAHIEVFELLFAKYFSVWQSVGHESLAEAVLLQDSMFSSYRSRLAENQGFQNGYYDANLNHRDRLDISHSELEAAKRILLEAILSGDERAIALLAKSLAAKLSNVASEKIISNSYYLSLFSRLLGLDEVKRLLGIAIASLGQPQRPDKGSDELTSLSDSLSEKRIKELAEIAQLGEVGAGLLARDFESMLAKFTALLSSEIASIISAIKKDGAELPPKTVGNFEFLRADENELNLMRKELKPLSGILAARLKKTSYRGKYKKVNFHSTFRKSLATQGVPFNLLYKRVNASKPEITVIADVSGSVASFARFSLHLITAIADEFDKVNSFIFIDEILDVTKQSKGRKDYAEMEDFIGLAAAASVKGHSDYGYALQAFTDRYMKNVLSPRTTVILLGDARSNYHPPRPDLLAAIKKRSKNLYFINPEPRRYWNTGDSIVDVYGAVCDKVVECRTLNQLADFIDTLSGHTGSFGAISL